MLAGALFHLRPCEGKLSWESLFGSSGLRVIDTPAKAHSLLGNLLVTLSGVKRTVASTIAVFVHEVFGRVRVAE